jgi:hypothetical protein
MNRLLNFRSGDQMLHQETLPLAGEDSISRMTTKGMTTMEERMERMVDEELDYTEERFFQESPCEWDEIEWLKEDGFYPLSINQLIEKALYEFFSPERDEDELPF